MAKVQARLFVITGRVQGVGFRPFVNRIANEFGLVGWVRNRSGQVEITVEGDSEALAGFQQALYQRKPPLAQPEAPHISKLEIKNYSGFSIEHSEAGQRLDSHIPPDYFVCADCLLEMQDPTERRYRYPFINCTQCGPRYTLIDKLPYDRPNTAMQDFPLCTDCRAEYSNPLDRRFHAQPLACARCGPELNYRQAGVDAAIFSNEQAITQTLTALQQGLIVAVKGVGGYHLLCDASNTAAVQRLRQRKHRPDKPLAVLVPWQGDDGLAWVKQIAELSCSEQQLLVSPLRPIVLVKKKHSKLLSPAIAPGLNELGLMLPYSPLHHLLANDYALPLVATSANLSGEAVLTDEVEVEKRLSKVADAFLHHNRAIRRPADDSVFRQVAQRLRPIRLGRGLAPVERQLSFKLEQPLLALGADLKNTVALAFENRFIISPHIGDLGSLRSMQVFEQLIADYAQLYGVKAKTLVCDAHPAYYSSLWAKRQGLRVLPVYHHHAHASALAGEHHITEPMLVFTWDGTGYGEEGSIWGGEALLGSPGQWQRAASIRPFLLPGGEKASTEPWRSALSVCWEQGIDWPDCPNNSDLLKRAWQQGINCPLSSSVGRLFDAAAALIGIGHYCSYEGHVAMQMEAISSATAKAIALPLRQNSKGLFISDWGPLLVFLINKEISQSQRSSVFHASLAGIISSQAQAIREKYNITRVGLSGGVFQNRVLTERASSELKQQGFEVYLPEKIPSGDGGISFGQIIEAANSRTGS